jgi:hypothetical protein
MSKINKMSFIKTPNLKDALLLKKTIEWGIYTFYHFYVIRAKQKRGRGAYTSYVTESETCSLAMEYLKRVKGIMGM